MKLGIAVVFDTDNPKSVEMGGVLSVVHTTIDTVPFFTFILRKLLLLFFKKHMRDLDEECAQVEDLFVRGVEKNEELYDLLVSSCNDSFRDLEDQYEVSR